MRVNFYDFGRDGKPHHAIGVLKPEDMEEGPANGCGLLVCELRHPSDHTSFGETLSAPSEDDVDCVFGLWFHCEESLDAFIDKLNRAKKLFQEEDNGNTAER